MPASRADRLVDNFFILLKCSIAILVISYLEDFISYRRNREEFEKVIGWLKTHSSSSGWNENSFYDAGNLISLPNSQYVIDSRTSFCYLFLDFISRSKTASVFISRKV